MRTSALRLRPLSLLLTVTLVGCDSLSSATPQVGVGNLLVRTDRASYEVGDRVRVEFVNQGEDELSFVCYPQLQQRAGLGWLRGPALDLSCDLRLQRLPPGETRVVGVFVLPTAAQAGWHRFFWKDVYDEKGFPLPTDQLVSPEFEIIGSSQ